MGNTIKFGVHRNPLKDAEGRETYHVRHETDFALNQDYIISKVKTYNAAEASHVNAVISVLKEQWPNAGSTSFAPRPRPISKPRK